MILGGKNPACLELFGLWRSVNVCGGGEDAARIRVTETTGLIM